MLITKFAKIEEPDKSLFLFDEDVLSSIEKDMKENGYDKSQLIPIWRS